MRKPLTPKEELEAIRTLLSDQSRWTTDTLARNENGKPVNPCSETAVCWCIEGAIRRVRNLSPHTYIPDYDPTWHALISSLPVNIGIIRLNDEWGYDAIMGVIKKALEKLT